MKIVVAASLVLLLLGDATDVFAFQVSPGTTMVKHQNRVPRLDYTMEAYDAMYRMYTTESKDVVPVSPAVSEHQRQSQNSHQEQQTVSSTPSFIQTTNEKASPPKDSLEGYQQSQGGQQHLAVQAAIQNHPEQMSTSFRAASDKQTKHCLAVQATLKAQQDQIAASVQEAMKSQNKRLSASVQAAAKSLADVLDSMSQIEKGVPPSIIQGAALATFSLSLVTTRDLTLSGLAGVTSAYLSITPGLVGNAVRSAGEKFTEGLSEAGALLNQAVAAVRATKWDIEKIRNTGSSFLVKYVKNIHQQAAKLMPFLFRSPKDEQEHFGVKGNRVTDLFFANETHHVFDSDYFFATLLEKNGAAPAKRLPITQHETEMTQEILLHLIEEYVQEAEDILAGLKAEEEATGLEGSSVAHGGMRSEITMQRKTKPSTIVQSETMSTVSKQSGSAQSVEAVWKQSTTASLTEAPESGASAQPVRSSSTPAQVVSNYSWKSASENLSSTLPHNENMETTTAHGDSVPLGQVYNDTYASSTTFPRTWFPASDIRSSNGRLDDLEGTLREETAMDDAARETEPAESPQVRQVVQRSSSWSTGGYLDNL